MGKPRRCMNSIKMKNVDLYPIVLNPLTFNEFKKLRKEDIVGIGDIFLLYTAIIQWNTLGISWLESGIVLDELGFEDDYANELLDFLVENKILTVCE